jgi:hypothetical protein
MDSSFKPLAEMESVKVLLIDFTRSEEYYAVGE